MKCNNNFLIIPLLCILINFSYSEPDETITLDNKKGTKSIYINDKIIYIFESGNNTIISYPSNKIIGEYSSSFASTKDILKIDDSKFVIIGQNTQNQICLQTININDDNLEQENSICPISVTNSLSKMEGKYIKNNQLIIYFLTNRNFVIYVLQLNRNEYIRFETIVTLPNLADAITTYIKCESFSGEDYLCIYFYETYDSNNNRYWVMNYIYSDFMSKISGIMCSDCENGNIIKIKDIKEKYLICYMKKNLEGKMDSIICQYYYYEDRKLNFGRNYNIMKGAELLYTSSPSILLLYENTIFFLFNYYLGTSKIATRMILFSPDLKFYIHSDILDKSSSEPYLINNLIINSISYLLIYDGFIGGTYLTKTNFKFVGSDLDITLSQDNNYIGEIIFSNNDRVMLSIDENLNLYENEGIVGMTGIVDLSSSSVDTKYSIRRNGHPVGVFYNYIDYINSYSSSDFYSEFSLIYKVTVTVCYNSCGDCIKKEIGNSTNHLCSSCITGYHPISSDNDQTKGFNCYANNDPEINNYYEKDGNYYLCDISCKNCTDDKNCISCSNNYYFKADEEDNIIPGLCFTDLKENYALDNNANILYKGIMNKIVYKKCHEHCLSCKGTGTDMDNNCITCSVNYIKYNFLETQCLIDKQTCLDKGEYWEFEDNNIRCASYTDRRKYIVMYEESKGQIVDNCQTFKSPYSINTMYFSLNNCNGINYCIPLIVCLRGVDTDKFVIDIVSQTCERTRECDIDFKDDDPFHDDDTPYPVPSTILDTSEPIDHSNRTEREKEAAKREKIWRKFDDDKELDISDFNRLIMKKYTDTLKYLKESSEKDIYLMTTFKYKNYTINIFPLDVEFENYVYNHIIIPYNLNYINFIEYFTNFWNMEIDDNLLIIALIESNCSNSAINELNYYFYKYNDKTYTYHIINLPSRELPTKGNKLDVIYQLKNYKNSNSNINARNKEYLVDNIRNMYKKYPDIELSNIDDPFYNDICTLYTTDVDTDMTLNDRRKEFFVNISLCENNCVLKKVIDKDRENVKSVCNCEIKKEYTTNTNVGKKDNIPLISSYNIESFVCISEAFKSQNISKNPIFWILLLIIIFLIVMLLAYILYGNDVLKRMFKFGKYESVDENSNIGIYNKKNSEIKVILNEEKKENENEKEKEIFPQDNMVDSKIDKNEGSIKLSKIENNKDKDSIQSNDNVNILSNDIKNNKMDELSNIENNKKENPNSFLMSDNNNINVSNKDKADIKKEETYLKNNPPKKKEERKNDSMFTKTNNDDKDLISSDISFSKRYKEEYNTSEISFDKISKEKPIYIDNLINPGIMLENNYLDFPINYEKNIIFRIYQDALDLNDDLNDPEINNALHHYDTMEDYYPPESDENNEKNFVKNAIPKKQKRKRNPKVTKLLDGDDLFIKPEKNYESDNYCEKDYNNNKIPNKNKSNENDEGDLFEDNLFINNIELKKFIKKKNLTKDKKNKLIEESKQNYEQEKENSSKKGFKLRAGKNRFFEYLNKKNSKNEEDSKYGNIEDYKNARLKTEFNENAKNMIRSTLKHIGKEGVSSDEDEEGQSSSFTKNINFKPYNSLMSEKNKLMGKKNEKNNNVENNEIKPGKKQILQFQEEDNYIGNNLMPMKTIKKKTKKRKLKNKKGEPIDVKDSDDIEERLKNLDHDKKTDFDIFYEKALGSSIASFVNIENEKVIIEENIFVYYWKYLKKRELFIICFFDKKDTIPYFIRWSCFFFSLIFIFLLNCFFFFESMVHKRYIHALQGDKINIAYYFKYEFWISICVSLIIIVYKMIIIKLLLYRVFKIKKDIKKMMHHSFEEKINKKELKNLEQKRYDYLLNYHYKIVIYFSVMIFLSLFFTYICICYGGVFENSLNIFFLGFLFSAIFSFIFCAAICFIIVGINKISRMFKNKCLLSIYVVLSTIY